MIMVITRKDDFREKICSCLEEKGYRLCIPANRKDVLPLVKEKNPVVILLDLYVSEPSGLKVLKELRTQNYTGKVIALAGTSISPLISEAWQFGVEEVIGGMQGNGEGFDCNQVQFAIQKAFHASIAKRAFELYEANGQVHGNDLNDWMEAERQILQSESHRKESRSSRPPKAKPVKSKVVTSMAKKSVSRKKKATAT